MTFDELCGSALGSADYTAISEAFHTIFVHGVPMMNLVHINQARHFLLVVAICVSVAFMPRLSEPSVAV